MAFETYTHVKCLTPANATLLTVTALYFALCEAEDNERRHYCHDNHGS